jgi:general secretion pathway protein L
LSASDALLIFLDARNEFEGWLQLRDGAPAAHGAELEGLPPAIDPETRKVLPVVAIVPGEKVTLHWLEVPTGLAPAQAVAAARLMALEMSAQPLSDMHVAVGREAEGETVRTVALVPALTMAGWLGRLQAHGLDPDLVLPEPLLLPRPAEGFIRYDRGDLPIFRGPNDAFTAEPELAGLILAGAGVQSVDHETFQRGIAGAIEHPPVNLRQGAFAKRRRWQIQWKLIRRLALLGLAILMVTLAIQVAAIMRYTFAADALELEAQRIASRALPGTVQISNAPEQLERRVSELGGGVSYSAIATALFGAVNATPNAELTALVYDPDGSLRATVQGDSPATVQALQDRIRAGGFTVEAGPMRTGGGRPTLELTVRAQ